ncbi:MAG: flagellar export chaperone FlgN [Thermodesulfobacteriota bacterium]|nr:flagellar export chaperone FlgN [Thermodesulfobacteriota bacterium]
MLQKIKGNLRRQEKGLEVLFSLLEEEFSQLTGRNPQAVTKTEFSIHELIRQLAAERLELRAFVREMAPSGEKLTDILDGFDEAEAKDVREVLAYVDAKEQAVAVQAEKNARMAYALAIQGRNMLDFIQKKIIPDNKDTYSSSGRFRKPGTQGALLSGRL